MVVLYFMALKRALVAPFASLPVMNASDRSAVCRLNYVTGALVNPKKVNKHAVKVMLLNVRNIIYMFRQFCSLSCIIQLLFSSILYILSLCFAL